MKKIIGVLLLFLSFTVFSGWTNVEKPQIIVFDSDAEETTTVVEETTTMLEEPTETESEIEKPCQINIEKNEHGTIEVSASDGEIGDIIEIRVKHDLLYKVANVKVNGTVLVESEETSGLYLFTLTEGENVITAEFVIDEELCGTLTTIVKQASEKDWTNLFTMENVITLIKWLLDGGILIAMIRYFIKDKRLADKVEKKVKETVENIIPDATKNAVVADTKTLIEPMFTKVVEDGALLRQVIGTMVKCMTLMQENTPEAKLAILSEFEKMTAFADLSSIASIREYIEKTIKEHEQAYQETLERLNEIEERHQENVEVVEETVVDDGTQI